MPRLVYRGAVYRETAGVVYHGTGPGFSSFSASGAPSVTGNVTAGWGVFFTPNRQEALRYIEDFHHGTGTLISAVLKLGNPYSMSSVEFDRLTTPAPFGVLSEPELRQQAHEFKRRLVQQGHDGIILRPGQRYEERVVFSPGQIEIVDQEQINV